MTASGGGGLCGEGCKIVLGRGLTVKAHQHNSHNLLPARGAALRLAALLRHLHHPSREAPPLLIRNLYHLPLREAPVQGEQEGPLRCLLVSSRLRRTRVINLGDTLKPENASKIHKNEMDF